MKFAVMLAFLCAPGILSPTIGFYFQNGTQNWLDPETSDSNFWILFFVINPMGNRKYGNYFRMHFGA